MTQAGADSPDAKGAGDPVADAKPGLMPRRRFLRKLAVLGGGLAIGSVSWQAGTRHLEVTRLRLPLPGLTSPLRAVFLSDLHLCTDPWKPLHCSRAFLRSVVERAREEAPQILFCGGDLASPAQGGLPAAREALAILAEARPSIGAWGALGNHDIKYKRAALAEAYQAVGFPLLQNQWETVEPPAGTLSLGGVVFRRDPQPLDERLPPPPAAHPRILLAHDPAIVYDLGDRGDWCDLILSGHTHGGQVVLPFIGSPWAETPANPEYLRGLFHLQEGPTLHVNRGIGTVLAPFRIGSRPELTVLELLPAPA
jgi:uncharacterized protein